MWERYFLLVFSQAQSLVFFSGLTWIGGVGSLAASFSAFWRSLPMNLTSISDLLHTQVIGNLLEHFPNMHALLFGRVVGGISTCLLFSAFESWMVAEHRKCGFPEELLSSTFSIASSGDEIFPSITQYADFILSIIST